MTSTALSYGLTFSEKIGDTMNFDTSLFVDCLIGFVTMTIAAHLIREHCLGPFILLFFAYLVFQRCPGPAILIFAACFAVKIICQYTQRMGPGIVLSGQGQPYDKNLMLQKRIARQERDALLKNLAEDHLRDAMRLEYDHTEHVRGAISTTCRPNLGAFRLQPMPSQSPLPMTKQERCLAAALARFH